MDLVSLMALIAVTAVGIFAVSSAWVAWRSRKSGKRHDDVSRETSLPFAAADGEGWCLSHTDGPVWHSRGEECARG